MVREEDSMTDQMKQNLSKWAGLIIMFVTMLAGTFHFNDRLNTVEEVATVICEAVEEAEA